MLGDVTVPVFDRYDLDIDTDEESTDELESSLSRLMLSPPPPVDNTLESDSGTDVPLTKVSDNDGTLVEGSGADVSLDIGSGLAAGVGCLSSCNINIHVQVRQNKIMNCFSGTAASVLKAPHYYFNCFLKIKIKKTCISKFHNIVIGYGHAVSLGSCGPLQVMLGSLFILNSLYWYSARCFSTVFC